MNRQYEDTETRRRQIAEAALVTIAEDGVARFTTKAIAARVGISDGTLFRHFGNKKEIVLEAMALLGKDIEAGLTDSGDSLQDVEAFFRHRAAFVGEQGSVGRLIFSESLVHLAGEEGQECIAEWRKASVGYLIQRLTELKTSGRVKDSVGVSTMSMLIQGSLLTFAMHASLNRGGSRAELMARVDHAWRALHNLFFI